MQGIGTGHGPQSKEPAPKAVNHLFEETRQWGCSSAKGGLYGNVVRISPALTAQREHVEEALEILDHAFARVQEAV
jgi:4-aminobutyrate aminotransferase